MLLAPFGAHPFTPTRIQVPVIMSQGDIILNSTNREIQCVGILIPGKIGQVSLVGQTNDWNNRLSGSKLILWIPPPDAHVYLAMNLVTFHVNEGHRIKIKVYLKWAMCQQELITFENIAVKPKLQYLLSCPYCWTLPMTIREQTMIATI
jgi:hypothetical protein